MRASRVVVLVLCACSSPAKQPIDAGHEPDAAYDIDEGATSGTRLKLRYYDFGNVRELLGIRDTQRAEDCTETKWADGTTYCVPADLAPIAYADDTCTQPIGVSSTEACSGSPSAYLVEYSSSPCGTVPSRLFRRGAPSTRTEHYHKSASGTCNAAGSSPQFAYYSLGAEVPVTELAALSLGAPAMTGRLGMQYLESVDGLRYPVQNELYDSVAGGRCSLFSPSSSSTEGRCLPIETASIAYSSDAACTQRLATDVPGCPAHTLAVLYEGCPTDTPRYFAVAAKQTPTTIYSNSSGTCTAEVPPAQVDLYSIGAELPLPALQREVKTGTERLQPMYFATSEGVRARERFLFDTLLGTRCYPGVQSNGDVMCVPFASSWLRMYSDAGCTNAIDIQQVHRPPACADPAAPLYAVNYTMSAACAYDYQVRRAGPLATGTIYRGTPGACAAYNPTNFVLYRVGDPVAPGDLATGMLVTAP